MYKSELRSNNKEIDKHRNSMSHKFDTYFTEASVRTSTKLSEDDIAKIQAVYSILQDRGRRDKKGKAIPITPERVRQHHQLLAHNDVPLFTIEQIQSVLTTYQHQTTQTDVEERSPVASIIAGPRDDPPAPVQIRLSHLPSSPIILVPISLTTTVAEVITRVQQNLGEHTSSAYLTFLPPTSTQPVLLLATDSIHAALGEQRCCTFIVRTQPDGQRAAAAGSSDPAWHCEDLTPAPLSRTLQFDTPAPRVDGSAATPTELYAPPSGQLATLSISQASKLHQFESVIQRAMKEAVDSVLDASSPFGSNKPPLARTILSVVLDLAKLQDKWLDIESHVRAAADGIPLSRRLEWFIEHILSRMDTTLRLKWSTQPQLETRKAKSYATWAQFQTQVIELVSRDFPNRPETIIHTLPELLQPLSAYHDMRHFVAKLRELWQASRTFVLLRQGTATAADQVDTYVAEYVISLLRSDIVHDLQFQLSLHHTAKAGLSLENFSVPQLRAYPVETILEVLMGRAQSRAEAQWAADFKPFRSLTSTSSSESSSQPWEKRGNKGFAGNEGARASRGPSAAVGTASGDVKRLNPGLTGGTDQRSGGLGGESSRAQRYLSDQRILTRHGQQFEFPYHLHTVEDKAQRLKLENQFVELCQGDLKCNGCGVRGHLLAICPRSLQLDHNLIVRNPKSFFYKLRPPERLLSWNTTAPTAPTQVHTVQMWHPGDFPRYGFPSPSPVPTTGPGWPSGGAPGWMGSTASFGSPSELGAWPAPPPTVPTFPGPGFGGPPYPSPWTQGSAWLSGYPQNHQLPGGTMASGAAPAVAAGPERELPPRSPPLNGQANAEPFQG